MKNQTKILQNCKKVPDWARYLTVDDNGDVMVWEGIPTIQFNDNGSRYFERNDCYCRWFENIGKTTLLDVVGIYKVEIEHITLEKI